VSKQRFPLRQRCSEQKEKRPARRQAVDLFGCGDRIWTCDLRVIRRIVAT